MILAKIVGTVVATRKDERLVSSKLLIAKPIDPSGKPEGNYLVAVDTDQVSMVGRDGALALDSYVFVAGKSAVRDVMVAGAWIVNGRRHPGEDDAARAWREALTKIMRA